MGNQLIFDILPFDPSVTLDAKIQLPIDLNDFVQGLQAECPTGEVHVVNVEGRTVIRLYISIEKYGPLVVANLITGDLTMLEIRGWPKQLAKKLILWYRHFVPLEYPLFLLIPESGYVAELTANTTLDDIEKMYPFPVPDE